ncbi:unnamed protein product [Callosobruchus maculatus]|uniref:Uncharacterized protein n=1 Tax=Callosobruchus maculatus TaxID=64391 RepID=A0A653DJM1_CALMS|nr:unnamed protein product [Callosobruchus maculatus]
MAKRKRGSEQKKSEVKKLTKKLKKIKEKLHLLDSNDSSSTTSSGTSDSSASDIEDSIDIANPEENIQNVGNQMPEEQTEIDFDFFGNKPLDQAQIGAPIHNEIAVRWSTILQAGLTAGERAEITGKFKIPENCLPLIPPKTNEEIQPCLPEGAAKHDKFIITLQTQLAHSLSAIGSVINQNLLVTEQTDNIKALGEACKLIANVHNALSVHRKYKIIPYLHPDCAKIAKTVKMDEQLFGKEFHEVFKNDQALKKSSLHLKKRNFIKATAGTSETQKKCHQSLNYPRTQYKWKFKGRKRRRGHQRGRGKGASTRNRSINTIAASKLQFEPGKLLRRASKSIYTCVEKGDKRPSNFTLGSRNTF